MNDTKCWFHNVIEPINQDTFLVCFECGHVYQTKQLLEEAYLELIMDLNKSAVFSGDPDFDIVISSEPKSADKIFSCPLCIHDF